MMKQFKVTVILDDELGSKHYIYYALNKEHAEFIIMNRYELVGEKFVSVEAKEVE